MLADEVRIGAEQEKGGPMYSGARARSYLETLAMGVPFNHAIWRASEASAITSWPISRPLLDIGCGDGSFAHMLFPAGVDAGLDMRHDQLRRAASRNVYRIRLRGNAAALPFRDASFQTVLSNCVLEHVPDVDTALREVGRVLQPGGHFIFTVPTNRFNSYLLLPRLLAGVGLRAVGQEYVDLVNRHFKHYHIDPPAQWEKRCCSGGMRVVEARFLMTRSSVGLWDALMPVAALQLLAARLGRKRFLLERRLARFLGGAIEPMLRPQEDGGNIAFLAVRER